MMHAMLILILAWTLADITGMLHTADFLQIAIADDVAPWAVPALTFVLAGLVSFSTGSSWGTMAILYPIILPLTWSVCMTSGLPEADALMIFYNTVSCVLAGSVLGDHCSPISDTTILSSMSSSCNHIDHVNTQMPYALTVGVIAIGLGTVPAALGVPGWLCMIVGIAVLYFIVKYFGKPTEVAA
jgi:Na+/H+ antiporter NhaC